MESHIFTATVSNVRSSSCKERSIFLQNWLDSNGTYIFNGKYVCAAFIEHSSRFHRALQSSIKYRTRAVAVVYRISKGIDSTICFITQLAELTLEYIPNTGQYHLPFYTKRDLYLRFRTECFMESQSREIPSEPYIHSTWKASWSSIKVRCVPSLSACSI